MKAITIRQPWAHAVIYAGKSTENRTRPGVWAPAVGQRIAIHAGKTWCPAGVDPIEGITGQHLTIDDVQLGVIIGTVYLADVHLADDCCDPWGDEQHGSVSRDPIVHLELDHPRLCDPIRVRGALGLWTVPEWAEQQLGERVR